MRRMGLRKGQHLFNEIARSNNLHSNSCEHGDFLYHNLHKILFYMTDKEFDSIMTKLSDGCTKE